MTLLNAAQILVTGSLLLGSAVAQTRFCIGGDLDHLSEAQRSSCRAKIAAVRATAASLHAPDGWHFVVVCGEDGWKDYASYATGDSEALLHLAAATSFEEHETFLRESWLDPNNAPAFRGILAHEVAAMRLQSRDEVAIQQEMHRLMPELAAAL